MDKQTHEFGPVFDKNSKILILGSFPSVKSRQCGFYYMHPQNRFWKCLSIIYDCNILDSIEDKRKFLIENNIALWDVVKTCKIVGSKDSKLVALEYNEIDELVAKTKVKKIYTNGRLADKKYQEFIYKKVGLKSIYLPSTSSANASYNISRLLAKWAQIRQ